MRTAVEDTVSRRQFYGERIGDLDIYRNYLAFASDTEAHMVYFDINRHRRDDT